MQEDLGLSKLLCNSKTLVSHTILLFIKIDILERKIKKVPIRMYFPEFTGKENNLNDVKTYIEGQFLSLNKNPAKPVQTIFANFVGEYNDSAKLVLDAIVGRLPPGIDTSL